ncbi:ectoine hydroxylase [Streptomyces sp. NPDC021224]|uniref:ectoine hydroxylase n=1 Tax=unclassified Streptomyces TaxID=2593676 RepID=UPI0037A158C5
MTTSAAARGAYPTRGADERVTPRQDPVVWSAPQSPGPFGAADLRVYERDGFLSCDALISPDEVAACRAELDRMCGDPVAAADPRAIVERASGRIRSLFEIHRTSEVFAALVRDPRLADRARQILGSDVYVHQSRINLKPGFGASGFYWHSDFETWHAEDGMPRMRAVSVSVALTDNLATNGSLMIMPGSHRTFLGCAGATPRDNYKRSLQMQEAGTPSPGALTRLAAEHGIEMFTGAAGSAVWFDCNCMHGSGDNITPFPRSNVFIVYNSVENAAQEPFAAPVRRPEYIGARDFTPVPRPGRAAAAPPGGPADRDTSSPGWP